VSGERVKLVIELWRARKTVETSCDVVTEALKGEEPVVDLEDGYSANLLYENGQLYACIVHEDEGDKGCSPVVNLDEILRQCGIKS